GGDDREGRRRRGGRPARNGIQREWFACVLCVVELFTAFGSAVYFNKTGEVLRKSTKHQAPSYRETPNSKLQNRTVWLFELGASLEFGVLCLEIDRPPHPRRTLIRCLTSVSTSSGSATVGRTVSRTNCR